MRAAVAAAVALAVSGCSTFSGQNPISPVRARIGVFSPAFSAGGVIPSEFTCQGRDISPPLRFAGVPRTARELDLVMRDPDAGNFVHWQLTGIPPTTRSVAAGQIPAGARPGRNSFGTIGYRGPCPPAGRAHHYMIALTARSGAATLGTGTLTGTYARP